MENVTLVIMAAGIGSRYGGGIKQLASVGPSGEIIMDYSIYDALEAGFNKVVFIIRRDLEKDFKEVIGNRIERIVNVAYAYQEIDDIPEQYKGRLKGRKKPWGTGQAILCCKHVVNEPFLVINADDYYGKEAYKEAYAYLTDAGRGNGKINACMVGFVLKNTLSENGTVTRGICKVDEDHMLTEIEETYAIQRKGEKATAIKNGEEIELDLDSPVSMNMWGLQTDIFDVLEKGFSDFLHGLGEEDEKAEYLLPKIIGGLLEDRAEVTVLESKDRWFGVTYQEDRRSVSEAIQRLIDAGEYPDKLFHRSK